MHCTGFHGQALHTGQTCHASGTRHLADRIKQHILIAISKNRRQIFRNRLLTIEVFGDIKWLDAKASNHLI